LEDLNNYFIQHFLKIFTHLATTQSVNRADSTSIMIVFIVTILA
jgi:hypothetical protein